MFCYVVARRACHLHELSGASMMDPAQPKMLIEKALTVEIRVYGTILQGNEKTKTVPAVCVRLVRSDVLERIFLGLTQRMGKCTIQ